MASIMFVLPPGDTVKKSDAPITVQAIYQGGQAPAMNISTNNGNVTNQVQHGNAASGDWTPTETGGATLTCAANGTTGTKDLTVDQ